MKSSEFYRKKYADGAKKPAGVGRIVGVSLFGFILIAIMWSMFQPVPDIEPSYAEQSTTGGQEVGAWVYCKEQIRENLKAPSTAKFPWVMPSVTYMGAGEYSLVSWVDSQNSYGAMIRTTFSCTAKNPGKDAMGWSKVDLSRLD